MELAQLCVDAAVYPRTAKERPGTADIRKNAFEDLLRQEERVLCKTFFGQVKVFIMKDYLGRQSGSIPDAVRQTANEIAALEHAKDTADIINKIMPKNL